jgi:hypothetical protein
MTQENLERAKELLKQIDVCNYEINNISKILDSEYTHTYLMSNRKMDFYKDAIVIDKDTFISFCLMILTEYQDKLSALETEFNNL